MSVHVAGGGVGMAHEHDDAVNTPFAIVHRAVSAITSHGGAQKQFD